MSKGIKLPDGVFKPENMQIEKINDQSCWLQLTLREGKNRIIRRGFEAVGHRVARSGAGSNRCICSLGNLKEGILALFDQKRDRSIA